MKAPAFSTGAFLSYCDDAMSPGEYLVLCIIDFGGDHLVGAQYMATVGESP